MTSVRRALVLSLLERYLLIALSLVSNVVLARLLTPEQIGVYSVSLAVIGIVQVLRDFGVGNFLIQERNLTEAHVRSAFGISLLMGAVLFPLVFFGADWAARFYDEPRMRTTLRIVSLNFLVLPFCSISLALLRREMRFKRLLWVSVVAAVVGLVVSVGLAWIGFGADAMAVGAVATNVATGLGAWSARDDRRLILPALDEWRPILRFGTQSSAVSVIGSVAVDTSDLFLGKLLGFAPVAMISRANGLVAMIYRDLMGAVRNVALPAFAQQVRAGDSTEQAHVSAVANTAVLLWPVYGFMALFGLEIIRLMFGRQWDAAVPLLAVLCLNAALGVPTYFIGTLLTATGRMDILVKAEPLFQLLRIAIVVVAALTFKSMEAVVWGYVFFTLIYVPGLYFFKQRCLPTDFSTLARNILCSAGVSILSLVVPAIVVIRTGWARTEVISFGTVAICASITIVVWLMSVLAFRHPLANEPLFVIARTRITSRVGIKTVG